MIKHFHLIQKLKLTLKLHIEMTDDTYMCINTITLQFSRLPPSSKLLEAVLLVWKKKTEIYPRAKDIDHWL